jgi:tetratricopeptide (TPR) repeat protein
MMVAMRAARLSSCILIITWTLLIVGCASTPQTDALFAAGGEPTQSVELADVPFFPQTAYQCGPAALATVLASAGAAITPDDLAAEVYLPDRRGSLQFELMAAARRHGHIPYVLEPRLDAVLNEVAAGTPVLVLQNLGLGWYPKWHYAVVVGFDLSAGEIILRSGEEARHVVPIRVFERTWERGGFWAMVGMPPDRLPHTAEEESYVLAILSLERLQRWRDAAVAYDAALSRWPDNLVARIGLGNSRYALGDLPGAEAAYRRATGDHPDAAVAFNNLAQVLAEQGRLHEAEQAAREAVRLGGPMREQYEETLDQILAHWRGTFRG